MGMLIALCGLFILPFSFEVGLLCVFGGFFWRGTEQVEREVAESVPVLGEASGICGVIVGLALVFLLILVIIFSAFGVPPEYLK